MTKKYYPINTTPGGAVHGTSVGNHNTQTTDPGTGSPAESQMSVLASAVNQLVFAFYTPSGEPNSADWPDGTSGDEYICQVDVATAGADLSYGVITGTGGHHARVNSGLSSDLEIETESNPIGNTGTGIKTLLLETETWDAGSASDRYEVLIGCDNGNMMAQTLGINVNTSNTFLQGPWEDTVCSVAAYRARNDDGSETTATWKAAQSTSWTQPLNQVFRLRFEIDKTSGPLTTFNLQYRVNGGSWNPVHFDTGLIYNPSPDLTNGEATTNQLTAGAGTFRAGHITEFDANPDFTITGFSANEHTEIEAALLIVAGGPISNGNTVEVGVFQNGALVAGSIASMTIGSAGNQYNQGLTASLGFSGSTSKQAGKALSASQGFSGTVAKSSSRSLAGALGFGGAIAKRSARALSGALSFTGSLASVKAILRSFTADLTFSGAIAKQPSRTLAASLGFSGSTAKQTRKPLAGSLGFSGAISRATSRALAGSLSFAGAASKRLVRAFPSSLSFTGALATAQVISRAFTATLGFTGGVVAQAQKNLAASLGFSGATSRQTRRSLTASLGLSGTLTGLKAFFRSFDADLGFSAALSRQGSYVRSLVADLNFSTALSRTSTLTVAPTAASLSFSSALSSAKVLLRAFSATLDFTGDLAKQAGKSLSGGLSMTGQLSRSTARALAGALSFVGNIATEFQGGAGQFFESFSASLSFSSALRRDNSRSLAGSLGFSPALNKGTSRSLAAALGFSASVTRSTARALSAGLSFTGALNAFTLIARSFEAALSFAGNLNRTTERAVAASVTFEGQVSRFTTRALSGALTPSGGLSRMTARSLAASLGFVGDIVSQVFTGGTRVLIAVGRVSVGLVGRASLTMIGTASSVVQVSGKSIAALASRFTVGKE